MSETHNAARWGELAPAALIQAAGSVALLFTVILLAREQGPEIQGAFSALRAEIQFLASLLVFGFPQAAFYFLAAGKAQTSEVVTLALVHGSAMVPLVAAWSWITADSVLGGDLSGSAGMVLAITVGLALMYTNLRGAILHLKSTRAFSATTAAPSVFLLLVVMAVLFALDESLVAKLLVSPWVFLFAYLLATSMSLWMVAGDIRSLKIPSLGSLYSLARFGFSAWLTSACQAAVTLLILRWIGTALSEPAGVGAVSAAIALVATVLTPLNMAVPLLFKWWTNYSAGERVRQVRVTTIATAAIAATAVLFVYLAESLIVSTIFGSAYLAFAGLYSVVAASMIPQALLRVWGVFWNSNGKPHVAAIFEAMRLVLVAAAIWAFGRDIYTAVFAWLIAEYLALISSGLMHRILIADKRGAA